MRYFSWMISFVFIVVVALLPTTVQASLFNDYPDITAECCAADLSCGEDSCDYCTSCRAEACGCDYFVPNMLGDGGLLQPRIIVTGSRVFCMQNHAWKVAENNSAIPQNRLGFNYNGLQDVILGDASNRVSRNVEEYRFLLEKTFFDGRMSCEFMIPFYWTSKYHINNTAEFLEGPQLANEFGDLAFGFKWMPIRTDRSAWSVGLRIEAPTAQDIFIAYWPSSLNDEVWHFTPYIAAQWTPNEKTFVNFFGSYRLNSTTMLAENRVVALNGDAALSIREASYLMIDASMGRWWYHDPHSRGLTGIAPMLELHYTTTPTSEPAYLYQGIPATGSYLGHTDYLNLTAGIAAVWNERTSVSAGFAFPLRYNDGTMGPTDRTYDWAFLFNVNIGMGR